jgi:hypothetical protein
MSEERKRGDENDRQPELIRIQGRIGAVPCIRQQRKYHRRQHTELKDGVELLGLDQAHPAVQHRLQIQQQCNDHGSADGEWGVAARGQCAQAERRHRGNRGGDAQRARCFRRAPEGDREKHDDGQ